ncbi:formin-like protein 5 [Onychostruthus taczanowskii]|uniref:formin-like protein 5 n=1 Tax=Onychostruthus taczanowskii TaxID=356909 RepID=UPI001B805108|nr:formin-like protein 5 [Onychostruthus taczanowskii]
MAEGTEPCSSGDGRGDSAEHRDHPVSHPGAAPSCAQERECWDCWDAAGAGSVSLGGTWPWPLCSRRAGGSSGCGQGVPVLEGTVSTSRLAVPGGHIPCGRCQMLQPPGCPSVPSGRWGPDQPRDEGPLWLKPHGAGAGLGQRPCKCHLVSAGSPLHRSHPTSTPSGLSSLQPPHPRVPPLCSACAQPWGAAPVPVPVPAPLSPRCCCPSVPGVALGTEPAPAAPPPPHWCELGVLRGGPQRAPWGHCGPTAARDPPAPPGLTPPAPPAPPPVLFLKSSVLFQCRALCTVAPFLCTILAVQV